MAQQQKKKRGPPTETLPNKQIFPLIGLGTYKLNDKQKLTEVLRHALQVGYRHIDTARLFNNQSALGFAIETCIHEGRVKRQQLFITTKTFNHTAKSPLLELKEALKLMNLEYVDMYYLQLPGIGLDTYGTFNRKPIHEVWQEMEECVRKGYTKHIAVCNFNGQSLMDLLAYCKIKPVANQIELHPFLQQPSLVELCQRNGVLVVAHTPLARAGTKEDHNIFKQELLIDLAQKYNRSVAQIVLKSALARGVAVVPKSQTPNRLQENYECWNFEISEEDMKKIKGLSRGTTIYNRKKYLDDNDIFE